MTLFSQHRDATRSPLPRESYDYSDGEMDPGPSDWWRRLRISSWMSEKQVISDVGIEDDNTWEASEDIATPRGAQHGKPGLRWWRREAVRDESLSPDTKGKRQDSMLTTASTPSPTSGLNVTSVATSNASSVSITAPLFVPPPSTFSTSTVSSTTTSSLAASTASTTLLRSTTSGSSRTFTSLWSATRTSATAASPTFISGVTFNLTLGGTRDDEAVYAVEVDLGHGLNTGIASAFAEMEDDDEDGQEREGTGDMLGAATVLNAGHLDQRGAGGRTKRQSESLGAGYQRVKLQVDLGSSDMWVASTNCTSSDCRAAPARFDASAAISSGVRANMTYHSGSVSGPVLWDEVQLDKFAIAYQAFIGGDRVLNENLGGGDFSGVLGMALPANSIISTQIPGTTSSNPDGATFLDNLFGSGTFAPSQRIFSLALERREDVRTTSVLTIGSVYDKYCPAPCVPPWIPIVANPRLGPIGYLHWRVPLMGVQVTTWADPQRGIGPTQQSIPLGPSTVVTTRTQPLAVLDSGGVAVLVANKAYADAIYGAYGISASSDGYYRMPCRTQLAFSFNFGGTWHAAHPLDMSWPDPEDPAQTTCIGAIQYASTLASSEAGDFVFGSAFLKNVYTVFSYPDQSRNGLWQPQVGLIGLTNASVASQDFYAVRSLRQSLASVSSQGPFLGDPSSPSSPSSTPSSAASGGSVVNTTAIVAGSVIGFFVLAAAAFCAWWFFLKRKYGASGYPSRRRNGEVDTPESESAAKLAGLGGLATGRSRKHQDAHRQKSMIEGYSDYEGDSWTEGGESIALGYMPEVYADPGGEGMKGRREGSAGSSMRTSRLAAGVTAAELDKEAEEDGAEKEVYEGNEKQWSGAAESTPPVPASRSRSLARSSSRPRPPDLSRPIYTFPPSSDPASPTPTPTTTSPSAPLIPSGDHHAPPPPLPRGRSRDTARSAATSISMSGPFPSTTPARHMHMQRQRQRQSEIDISPMYEIHASDYFDVSEAGGAGGRGESQSRDRGIRRASGE